LISEDVVQKVKESSDIVDVIGQSVKLKRAGKYYVGLCPFHNEKSPSFTVTPDKQIYKCFGCGEAGNVISFVMKTRNISFTDAVQVLADKANITITHGNNNAQQQNNLKLYNINVETARFYFYNLRKNKNAMQYLSKRGVTTQIINKFGLGYASDSWDSLIKFLKGKGYTELDMLNAGLIIKSEKGTFYDRFRNRIIFPVFDYRNKVIGFGGRVLDNSKPKYLNSPETPIFHKGTNLYGLNFASKDVRDRTLIIVEGYMDCISLYQYGMNYAVASLGTALTPSQAKLLKRFVDKIIISYDADAAGQNATLRGLDILKDEGLEVKVLIVPDGKDPDEYLKNHGREAFVNLIEDALPIVDYKLGKIEEKTNFQNSQEVVKYTEEAAEVIRNLHPVEKDKYIKKISTKVKLSEEILYQIVNKKHQKDGNNQGEVNIESILGNKLYIEPTYIKAERLLIRISIKKRELTSYIKDRIKIEDMILESHQYIFNTILENTNLSLEEIGNKVELDSQKSEIIKEWVSILQSDISNEEIDYKLLIDDCIREIKRYKLEEKKNEIMSRIKEYEANGNVTESMKVAKELMNVQKQLNGLQ